jgi:Peptidyl-tRNA hydrolase PTH2
MGTKWTGLTRGARGLSLRSCIAITEYLTHYCVVRADLPFGVQAAQLIHATGQSLIEQHSRSTYAVALQVPDEAELRALSARLAAGKIAHTLIIEEDPPYAGQAMAIGILPTDRKRLKPFLSTYALVAQSGRAPRVMTSEAPGSNPGGRAISP